MKRKDFQDLAAIRLKEARVLLQANCWEGAYYLGGYAAECALKACIARQTERYEFPDKVRVNASHTHDLDKLLELAGLNDALRSAETTHGEFHTNWKVVAPWWEQSRYERPSQADAETLLKALSDRQHGVLRWLKHYY